MPALDGVRVGVTASRRADDQIALLRRRGAEVLWAPVLRVSAAQRHDEALREATEQVLAEPVDMLVATTAIGVNVWLDAAANWGREEALLAHLAGAEILARGPKTIGAVRARGLRELWSPESECFGDLLAHLAGRDLSGLRIVVQEFGRSLASVVETLTERGAQVRLVSSYRIEPAESAGGVRELVEAVAGRQLDAVTFTAAPAVAAFLGAARVHGCEDEVLDALREDVLALSVGPVTGAEFEARSVPTTWPERSRLGALVTHLADVLPVRERGVTLRVAGGRELHLVGPSILLDGQEVKLTPAPAAVLRALAERPGHVVSRPALLATLPSGNALTEHAVEMAIARLRQAVGAPVVQTAIKRGYRLAVS